MHTKVKICGLTNLEDALVSAEAAADYLGFIFYPPSKRAADPETVRQIVAQLRQRPSCPTLVGVFVNETAANILAILEQCQLDLAQLSGEEVPALVNDPVRRCMGGLTRRCAPPHWARRKRRRSGLRPRLPTCGRPCSSMPTTPP
ncbi:MAG: phosphoribosylanthranilate isomerase [Chloroflexi bacterium]|nr:phosphoribosylanthranilate isomerase [Chloroflexota bacterium]